MMGARVERLLRGDTFYFPGLGLDVGHDLKSRVSASRRLLPRPEAFNDGRLNLDPANARDDDPSDLRPVGGLSLATWQEVLKSVRRDVCGSMVRIGSVLASSPRR
jgi:hypothetical protein